MKPLLVFDMDGVLVDVTESYRETIARTVEHFTGVAVTRAQIQDLKNQGGWNDDWKLSHHMVASAGVDVPFDHVKDYFQSIFLGDAVAPAVSVAPAILSPVGSSGLILHEQWVAHPGMLENLNQNFRFAVFTGRPRPEADLTLRRFAGGLVFHPLIAMGDVTHPKPAPTACCRSWNRTPAPRSSTSATPWTTPVAPAPRRSRSSASRPPPIRATSTWSFCSRPRAPTPLWTTSTTSPRSSHEIRNHRARYQRDSHRRRSQN